MIKIIPAAGLNLIRSFLAGDSPTNPTHGGVGTGTTGVTSGDTALETEVGTRQTTSTVKKANGIIDIIFTLPSTEANGNNLSEVALLTALSGGTLFQRAVHTAFAKTSSFAVKYRIKHTQVDV